MTRALVERLRRIEQQLRTLGELHVRELSDLAAHIADGVAPGGSGVPAGGSDDFAEVARKLGTIARLHADELRMVLDEIVAIAAEVTPPADAGTDAATRSPKRERWLAEEERRAHPPPMSRRELLRGRDEE